MNMKKILATSLASVALLSAGPAYAGWWDVDTDVSQPVDTMSQPAENGNNGYGYEHGNNGGYDNGGGYNDGNGNNGWGNGHSNGGNDGHGNGGYGNGHGNGGYGHGGQGNDGIMFGNLSSGDSLFVDGYAGFVRQGQALATFGATGPDGEPSDHVVGQSAVLSEGEGYAGGWMNFDSSSPDNNSLAFSANGWQRDASASQAASEAPGQTLFASTASTSAITGGFGFGIDTCAGGCPAGGSDD